MFPRYSNRKKQATNNNNVLKTKPFTCINSFHITTCKILDFICTFNLNKKCNLFIAKAKRKTRGGSRTAATSKLEHFMLFTIITKSSILDVAVVLDPPL